MSFQDFKNEWLGKRVDYDKRYGFQCVDLIKQYLSENFGLKPGAWGNAIDYYNNPNEKLLTAFDRLPTHDIKEGDIVVLHGLTGNPYGHIAIATNYQDGNVFEGLEQNGATGNGKGESNDAVRTRKIAKSRIAGVLRPKGTSHLETVKNPTTWNVRTAPNINAPTIGVVRQGDTYETEVVGDWRKINFRGKPGYVGPAAWR